LHQLSSSFVLGYHGCDREVAESILANDDNFKHSKNDYDWLGSGTYFWEANPARGLEFAYELQKRRREINEYEATGVSNRQRRLCRGRRSLPWRGI
jgi:hypothetical protein